MRTIGWIIPAAMLAALVAACGEADVADVASGTPPATDSSTPRAEDGGGGGCEETHRGAAREGEDQTGGGWASAALRYGQDGDEAWEPPQGTHTYAVGESFTIDTWTVTVTEINYHAREQVLAALEDRGLSYDGTPVEDFEWIVAQVELANGGTEPASPDTDLETRYVSAAGDALYVDYQCGMGNPDTPVNPGQTGTVAFGIPVRPSHADGGWWGLGPAEAMGEPDEEDTEHLAYVR